MTDNDAMMALVGIGLGAAAWQASRNGKKKKSDACGSGRFATADEVRRAGMFKQTSALILGRHLEAGHKPGELTWLAPACHSLVCSPTGGGKDVSLIVPFLLSCPDSCVVIDPKGEAYLRTARHRAKKFRHRIVVLDPFHCVTNRPHSLNPLDGIGKDSRFAVDDCRDLAASLELQEKMDGNAAHFVQRATGQIKSVLAGVVRFCEAPNRSLQEVRDIVTDPEKKRIASECMQQSQAWGGMLARMGHDMVAPQGDEAASIASTVHRHLEWLDTPAMIAATKESTFDPAELRGGRLTIYVVLPPDRKDAQKGWMRMVVSTLMRACIRGGIGQPNLVHFILNEFSSLGRLECVTQALDIGRGYSVRLQFYVQDLSQLARNFPEDKGQTLLGNCSQVFFATNSFAVAEYIAKRGGQETIVIESGGSQRSGGQSWQTAGHVSASSNRGWSQNGGWSQQGRSVLFPDEVLALSPRVAITFVAGMRPIVTQLIRFYEPGWRKKNRRGRLTGLQVAWVLVVIGVALALLAH